MKPHLIVIGTQKAGTTWIHQSLDSNKQFYLPNFRQEIHFFDKEYSNGLDYYLNLYRNSLPHQITVDVTPDYFYETTISEKLLELERHWEKECRLIVTFREPVSRLKSAYLMKRERGEYTNIQNPIINDKALIYKSLYSEGLERILSDFGRDRILILLFEEMFNDTATTLNLISRHIGSNTPIINYYNGISINKSSGSQTRILRKSIRKSIRPLKNILGKEITHRIKTISSKLFNNFNPHNPTLTHEEISQINNTKSLFKDDVYRLAKIIKRDDLPKIWGY